MIGACMLVGWCASAVGLAGQGVGNLILNGGFEQGSKHWSLTGAPLAEVRIVEEGAHSGRRCAVISLLDATSVDFAKQKFYIVSNRFKVRAESEYTLTFWWKYRSLARPQGALFWVHAWCYDANGKYIGDMSQGQCQERGTVLDWHRRVCYVKFAPGTASARICFELIGGAGEVWIDDVSLVEGRVDYPELRIKPKAVISATTNEIHLGEWLQLDGGESSCAQGRRLVLYRWQLPILPVGKGKMRHIPYGWEVKHIRPDSITFRPMHVGEFWASLVVMDSLGAESEPTYFRFKVLPNKPPKASFSWRVLGDGLVEFDASVSSDPDGHVTKYEWQFPDGSIAYGIRIKHKFAAEKFPVLRFRPHIQVRLTACTVRLIVTDNHGLQGAAEREVVFAPRAGRESPTLQEPIVLVVGTDHALRVKSAPRTCTVRLGYREYLPVHIVNHAGKPVTVCAEVARAERSVLVGGFVRHVGKSALVTVEIQSLLFWDTQLVLRFTAGEHYVDVPLQLRVRETMPLFGTQEHFTRTPPGRKRALEDMPFLAKLPCQVYRLPDTLTGIAGPNRNWETAEWYIGNLRRLARTRVAPFLGYIPTRMWNDLRDGKMGEWEASVRRIVQRFADWVDYWQPYNEPPWNKEVMKWFAERGADAMLPMQAVLFRVVREFDPTAKVMSPGWALHEPAKGTIEKLFEQGADRFTDIYCVHAYTCHTPLPLNPNHVSAWRKFDKHARGIVDWMLRLMKKHGINKPLWVTECGGPVSADRSKAMQWLRTVVQWLAEGVKGVIQYEFYDYPHDVHPPTFALMRSADHYPTDFFTAYRELIRHLTGAQPQGALNLHDDVTAFAFRRGNERIICLWSNSTQTKTVSLPIDVQTLVRVEQTLFSPTGLFMRKVAFEPWGKVAHTMRWTLQPLEFLIISCVHPR